MALTNIDKDHLDKLFLSLYVDQNNLETIKSNHVNYARLKQIAKQINYLKNEALEIIDENKIQHELQNLKTKFKLVSGTSYYLYQKKTEKYLSMISPTQWNNKDLFLGAYYYDYDKQFILIE